ncbi:hypothetical protein GIB67_032642 [Kingdonia uniflora]|uniref:Uncharacterized protein n=1 Tax=Kingdonia uniflora TaxID=39325 RepID=A0A7J7P9D3_9MAGN|nr:hypothetical protein GIB67_032642 [Kingdonia uniflora]
MEETDEQTEVQDPRLRRRLVLIPCPLQGHMTPMLQLATLLYSKGFSITIAHTHIIFPNQSNYPHFSFQSIISGGKPPSDVKTFIFYINNNCADPLKECLLSLLSKSDKQDYEPVVCIISDAMMYFAKDVADSLKLPRMVLRTSSAISYDAFTYVLQLNQQGCFPIQESRLEERFPDIPPLKFKDLPTMKTSDGSSLYEFLLKMLLTTKASSGLIWNTFQDLEKLALTSITNDVHIPLFAIGPLHKTVTTISSTTSLLPQDSTCISWLDKQSPNSVIYVSYGSIVGMDQTEFVEIAWGLANCGHPFLWVIRPNSVANCSQWEKLLPDGFHEIVRGKCCIVQWAPQQDVLAHHAVGGFWTHSGWNSTLESICEGVPMLCRPCFGDQAVNARFVSEEWRVGLNLENGLEREEIVRFIRKLMEGKEREEMMVRVKDLKEKAKNCINQGGSSLESLQSLINYILSFNK